jgi:hypothetical protein
MDYRGIAALVIALALGLTMVLSIAGLIFWNRPLGEKGAEALIAIGGAMVGMLASYIGGKVS